MDPLAPGSSPWPISADVIEAVLEGAHYVCNEARHIQLLTDDTRRAALLGNANERVSNVIGRSMFGPAVRSS
jgi:hypothetical protein